MRNVITGLVFSALMGLAATAQAADLNVGVVISGEIHPGVYGRVEIGDVRPPLVYERPMVILAEPRRHYEPLYLHVPPGHAKNWRRYCGRYNACNRPVYFVRSAEYEPGYRRDYDRERDRDDHRDRNNDHDRGNSGKHRDH